MARKKTSTDAVEKKRDELFAVLRREKQSIIDITARDTGIDGADIDPAFEQILDLVREPEPTPEQIEAFHEEGVRHARSGVLGSRVLDGYLSLNWAVWEAAMRQESVEREVVLDFADRLMRGIDSAIGALARGYVEVERELTAAHAERQRSVLEEMLTAPRSSPEARTRIRRRAERHGLSPLDPFRLILIQDLDHPQEVDEATLSRLDRAILVPVSHHREQPSIRLPQVLEWRGRFLVFAKADWIGEPRLRDALPRLLGDRWLAVDSGPIPDCDALASALAEGEHAIGVAADLGYAGWISDPWTLALETTFLLDRPLTRAAIDRELGPLLTDERMGEELMETMEVYLGARQNIRETARRMHLSPRTVAYRLERIETLLGVKVEGETTIRLGAALLALRVTRETDTER